MLTSIFFGGGTPSLMSEETVGSLIARAAKHWRFAPDIEITLGSQSEFRRSRPVRGLPECRRQSPLDRRSSSRRPGAGLPRPVAWRGRSVARYRDRRKNLSEIFLRSDICAARTIARFLARGIKPSAGTRLRSSLALSAHSRRRDELLYPRCPWRIRHSRTGPRCRVL